MIEVLFLIGTLFVCVLVLATVAGLILQHTNENFLYFVLLVNIVVISAMVAGFLTRTVFR